jgi:Methyltransferase domain
MVAVALKRAWLALPFSHPALADRLDKAIWYSRFARWQKAHPCPVSPTRSDVYDDIVPLERLTAPITYLEFGSYEGDSVRRWLKANTDVASHFVGFDSFEGLPESWQGYRAGHFATGVPQVDDDRCRFVVGYFQQTLPGFLADYRADRRQVIFMDADLYSSTSFVLHQLGPHLRAGDLLMFDEFRSWMHEFRAFVDFLTAFPLEYQTVLRSPDWSQVIVKVLSNPGPSPAR